MNVGGGGGVFCETLKKTPPSDISMSPMSPPSGLAGDRRGARVVRRWGSRRPPRSGPPPLAAFEPLRQAPCPSHSIRYKKTPRKSAVWTMKEMEAVGCGRLGAGHVGRDCDVGVEAAAHLWGGGSTGRFDMLLKHKNTSHPFQHIPPILQHTMNFRNRRRGWEFHRNQARTPRALFYAPGTRGDLHADEVGCGGLVEEVDGEDVGDRPARVAALSGGGRHRDYMKHDV